MWAEVLMSDVGGKRKLQEARLTQRKGVQIL